MNGLYKKTISVLSLIALFNLSQGYADITEEGVKKAIAFKKKGDWDKASSIFLNIIKSNQSCSDCYFHLGEIEDYKLNYVNAIAYYKKAAAYNPSYYYNLGLDYQTTGEWNASIEALNNYLKFAPYSVSGLTALGISYRKSGDLQQAEEAFKSLLELNPSNPSAHFNLALIYISTGKREEALNHIEMYKKISDTDLKFNITAKSPE